jgi:hypothetical protein
VVFTGATGVAEEPATAQTGKAANTAVVTIREAIVKYLEDDILFSSHRTRAKQYAMSVKEYKFE